MRTLSGQMQARIDGRLTSLTICWKITKTNGEFLFGTEHDRDILITVGALAGTYPAEFNITGSDSRTTSDLSVDNLEVDGSVDQLIGTSVQVADIESGVLDGASVIVFLVDWTDPDDDQVIIRAGYLGAIQRDTDGRYKAEIRGLMQKLSQQIGQNYSEQCNVVRFGDVRCGFDVASITQPSTVVSVTNRKSFVVTLVAASGVTLPVYLPRGGEVTWTSGDNAGFTREVKVMALDSSGDMVIELYEEAAADIQVGDGVDIVPGCDRLATTCRYLYDNFVNYRGYGLFVPGAMAMMRGNTAVEDCVVPAFPPPPPGVGDS